MAINCKALGKYFYILIIAFLAGCSGGVTWKEDVKISTGQIITIERELVFEGGGDEWALNKSGTKPKEYRILISLPGSAESPNVWKSTKLSPQTWPEIPLLIDFEDGQPVIFSLVAISPGCEVYSKYLFSKGLWHEVPLQEAFLEMPSNLLFGTKKALPERVSIEEKKKRNSGPGYRKSLYRVGPTKKVCGG